MFPTIEQLSTMSLKAIRLLDIRNAEEEDLVQAVINQKVGSGPVKVQTDTFRVPDIKTKEQEEHWQKIIDERKEAVRPKRIGVSEEDQVVASLEEEFEEHVKDAVIIETKKFCEFCTSKGVRHLKVCTKPK